MSKVRHEREVIQKILTVISVLWAIFLFPTFLLTLFVERAPYFGLTSPVEWILMVNILSFPFVIAISNFISWKLFFWNKHWAALFVILVPLLHLLIEVVLLDLYFI